MRYEVSRPGMGGETEGLLATDWTIDPSGALLFYDVSGHFKTFVIGYAPGQWECFFGAES